VHTREKKRNTKHKSERLEQLIIKEYHELQAGLLSNNFGTAISHIENYRASQKQ